MPRKQSPSRAGAPLPARLSLPVVTHSRRVRLINMTCHLRRLGSEQFEATTDNVVSVFPDQTFPGIAEHLTN